MTMDLADLTHPPCADCGVQLAFVPITKANGDIHFVRKCLWCTDSRTIKLKADIELARARSEKEK